MASARDLSCHVFPGGSKRVTPRVPLALDRLTESTGGQLLYQLRRPWRDGATALLLEPLELLERLAALVPPPRRPLVAYHGLTAPGLDEIEAGLREVRQIGAGRLEPFYLSLAAEAYARAGRPDDARTSVALAFAALAQSRDLAFAAEFHRIRAVLALRDGACGPDAAEADLRHALEMARQQEARSPRFRAARDLASMLAGRGERQQAHDLLAPVYDWFTEGFDTPDLKEAKALIDKLRAS